MSVQHINDLLDNNFAFPHILSMLPANELLKVKLVCQQWNGSIEWFCHNQLLEFSKNEKTKLFVPTKDINKSNLNLLMKTIFNISAYYNQYSTENNIDFLHNPIDPQFLELAIQQTDLRQDENLINFFYRVVKQVKSIGTVENEFLPNWSDDLPIAERAASSRAWMDNHKDALNTIKGLNLNGCGLTVLPPEIEQCRGLETLFLSGNKLKNLPFEIFDRLSSLGTVYVTKNHLSRDVISIIEQRKQNHTGPNINY